MAAKVAFIDRVLKAYGPETDAVRHQFREMVEENTRRLWPREDDIPAQFRPKEEGYDSVFIADQLELLTARDDTQRGPRRRPYYPRHGIWAASLAAGCPVGGLHFEADAHRGGLLAHAHFSQFQRACPAHSHGHHCFSGVVASMSARRPSSA